MGTGVDRYSDPPSFQFNVSIQRFNPTFQFNSPLQQPFSCWSLLVLHRYALHDSGEPEGKLRVVAEVDVWIGRRDGDRFDL